MSAISRIITVITQGALAGFRPTIRTKTCRILLRMRNQSDMLDAFFVA
jgi:hypothetical protein